MYKQTILSNGLKLITAPMQGTKTVTVLVMVGTGSKYENRVNNGISHFLEHMFFKGTKKWPDTLALSSALDSLGAEFNAFTGKEYTGYWVKTEAAKIEKAVAIVSEMLLNSKFSAVEIDREKGTIIEEINMYLDNPLMYLEDIFENCMYGDTPAGWDTIGIKENILRFKREDFLTYLNTQYGTHNTLICLAGNVGKLNSNKIASRYFADKKFKERGQDFQEKAPVAIAQSSPRIKISYKATDQAHLSLGVHAYAYNHPARTALKLLSIILGGSMSSRLFINLRERQGLAYYVRTETEAYTDSGYLTTRAGVPLNKIEQAVSIILQEYKKIKTTAVPAAELKRAKDILKGRMNIQLEASDDMANWYGRQAIMLDTIKRTDKRLKDGPATPEKYLREIDRIRPADIKRVAQEIFVNKHLNLAVIGPYKDDKKFEKIFKL